MPAKSKEELTHLCQLLQKQIKLGEEYNLDAEDLLKLKRDYDFYFKLLINTKDKE